MTEAKLAEPYVVRIPQRWADAKVWLEGVKDPRKRLKYRLRLWQFGQHAGLLHRFPEDEEEVATATELLTLACIKAEAGNLTEAAALTARAESVRPALMERLRFFGLTASLADVMPSIRERFPADIAAAARYHAEAGRFQALVERARGNVCVVGNAPSEHGRNKGAEIDSHDLVIRMNNFSTSPPFRADYGGRTDIWSRSPNYDVIWRRDDQRFRHIVLPGPCKYWRWRNGQDAFLEGYARGNSFDIFPQRLYCDLVTQLRSPPSSGIQIIYWLNEILGGLKGVGIYGFEMTDQTRTLLTHYYPELDRGKPVAHDWEAERRLFDQLLEARAREA